MAIDCHRREDGSSVAERKWDTWTRDEILAIRGYPVGSELSSAPAAAGIGGLAMHDDGLEASNKVPTL